jgi:hypothetical protein
MVSQLQYSNNKIKVGLSRRSRLPVMYHNNTEDTQYREVLIASNHTTKPLHLLLQRLLEAHTFHQRKEDGLVRCMARIRWARFRIPPSMNHHNRLLS